MISSHSYQNRDSNLQFYDSIIQKHASDLDLNYVNNNILKFKLKTTSNWW